MGLFSSFRSLFRRKREPERPLVSLVLLLRSPRELSEGEIREAVRQGLGIDVTDGEEDTNSGNFVVGDGRPSFVAMLGERTLLINNFPMPYVPDPEAAAEEIPELRLRQAVANHCAWLSVDQLRPEVDDENARNEAYRAIGPLIAELADDSVLALFEPSSGRMNVFEPSLLEHLRGPDPAQALQPTNVPVIGVADDDPRMIAAVNEARERWPEFVAVFENRRPEQSCFAKVRLAEGDDYEFPWISVTAIEGDFFYGVLDNDPIALRQIRCGSKVRVPLSDLNDWLYLDEAGVMHGGFTTGVIRRVQEGRD